MAALFFLFFPRESLSEHEKSTDFPNLKFYNNRRGLSTICTDFYSLYKKPGSVPQKSHIFVKQVEKHVSGADVQHPIGAGNGRVGI